MARLLVPVLDVPLEQALAAGEITVDAAASVRLADGLELPHAPRHAPPRRAALPPGPLARRERAGRLPPLLRHPGPGRRPGRRPVGLRADARAARSTSSATAACRACASTTSTACATRSATCRRLRDAVGAGRADLGREDPRPRRAAAAAWPVEGTTGYELAAAALDALVDPEGLAALERGVRGADRPTARSATCPPPPSARRSSACSLADVLRVARALAEPLRPRRGVRGPPSSSTPPSRCRSTAPTSGRATSTLSDRALLAEAVPDEELRAALLLELPGASDGALRFQQLTSPAMAKGVEDTALLPPSRARGAQRGRSASRRATGRARRRSRRRSPPGRSPGRPRSAALGDARLQARPRRAGPPAGARRELGEAWLAAVQRLEALEADRPPGTAPPRSTRTPRWLLWQTLVGAWPLEPSELPPFADRVRDYALKAAREAKERTSWTEPDEAYEHALVNLVARALEPAGRAVRGARGRSSSASPGPEPSTACRSRSCSWRRPGLPDVYQGTERWSFTLVDPDNRRPVDLAALDRDLTALSNVPASTLLPHWRDGRLKQPSSPRARGAPRRPGALRARRLHALDAGPDVLAFARELDGRWAVCAVPRSPLRRPPSASTLPLPAGAPARWRDVLDGAALDGPTVVRHAAGHAAGRRRRRGRRGDVSYSARMRLLRGSFSTSARPSTCEHGRHVDAEAAAQALLQPVPAADRVVGRPRPRLDGARPSPASARRRRRAASSRRAGRAAARGGRRGSAGRSAAASSPPVRRAPADRGPRRGTPRTTTGRRAS